MFLTQAISVKAEKQKKTNEIDEMCCDIVVFSANISIDC